MSSGSCPATRVSLRFWKEHLTDNDGELLAHVLFGDVNAQLLRLLEDLDSAILPDGEDDQVDNLVWVSFVENAQGVAGDAEEPLRNRLRSFPNLARALSYYE